MTRWPPLVEEEAAFIGNAFQVQQVFAADQVFAHDEAQYLAHVQRIIAANHPHFASFLDVGAGSGRLLGQLAACYPGRQFVGLDPVYRGERVRAGGVHTRLVTAERADVLLLKEVLQHVGQLDYALGCAAAMLRPGGLLIVIERNPRSFLGLLKPLLERLGRWMYPPDSPFCERWYSARHWRQTLARLGEVVYFERYDSPSGRRLFCGKENRFFVMAVRLPGAREEN